MPPNVIYPRFSSKKSKHLAIFGLSQEFVRKTLDLQELNQPLTFRVQCTG